MNIWKKKEEKKVEKIIPFKIEEKEYYCFERKIKEEYIGKKEESNKLLKHLNSYKAIITPHQHKTLRGQIKAGDFEGYKKGIKRILRKIAG